MNHDSILSQLVWAVSPGGTVDWPMAVVILSHNGIGPDSAREILWLVHRARWRACEVERDWRASHPFPRLAV